MHIFSAKVCRKQNTFVAWQMCPPTPVLTWMTRRNRNNSSLGSKQLSFSATAIIICPLVCCSEYLVWHRMKCDWVWLLGMADGVPAGQWSWSPLRRYSLGKDAIYQYFCSCLGLGLCLLVNCELEIRFIGAMAAMADRETGTHAATNCTTCAPSPPNVW